MNKITPSTYEDLKQEFLDLLIPKMENWSDVIDVIFDKAVEEPAFCATYRFELTVSHSLLSYSKLPIMIF